MGVRLLASGRDSDVYAYDEGRVLRRYRDGRSAEPEGRTISALGALGYSVPTVYEVTGPDIVMEHVEGPTLAESMFSGLSPDSVGRILAALHHRLHALAWPAARVGQSLLHLDLHPLNVIMRGPTPVVIDWSNARLGPPTLDVAMTTLILAQVVVAEDMLTSMQVAVPNTWNEATMRATLSQVLRSFTNCVGVPHQDHLRAAEALRRRDPSQSPAELSALSLAREFAATLA